MLVEGGDGSVAGARWSMRTYEASACIYGMHISIYGIYGITDTGLRSMHATRGRDSTCPACTEAERGGWTRHARCDGGPPGTRKGTGGQGAPRPCHFGVRSPRTDAPHRPCDTRGRAHAHTSQEGSSSTARSSSRAHHGAGPIAQAAEKQRRVPRRAVERGACWPPGGRRAHGQNHVAPPPHAPPSRL